VKSFLDTRSIDRMREGGALAEFNWQSYRGK